MEKLLRVRQGTEALGIGVTKLYGLMRQGELRPTRIGRAVRFGPGKSSAIWTARPSGGK